MPPEAMIVVKGSSDTAQMAHGQKWGRLGGRIIGGDADAPVSFRMKHENSGALWSRGRDSEEDIGSLSGRGVKYSQVNHGKPDPARIRTDPAIYPASLARNSQDFSHQTDWAVRTG